MESKILSITCPKILSGSALKLIACLSMLSDHLSKCYLNRFSWVNAIWFTIAGKSISLLQLMLWFGRFAFPIFVFLLVEGFEHGVHGLADLGAGGLGFLARYLALVHFAVALQHFQGGGHIIIHKAADLGRFIGLFGHSAEDAVGHVLQLIHLAGKLRVGDQVVFMADLSQHFLALIHQGIHRHVPGLGNGHAVSALLGEIQ